MSGLDDTAEPAAQEAVPAQDQGRSTGPPAGDEGVTAADGASAPDGAVDESAEQAEPGSAEPEHPKPVEPAVAPEHAKPTPQPEPVAATTPAPESAEAAVESQSAPAPEPEPVEAATEPVAPAPAPEPESTATSESPTPEPASAAAPEIGSTSDGGVIRPPTPQARPKAAADTGKIVEGLVTAVSAEMVELTLDDGRQAIIHRRNFSLTDEDPSAVLSVGDRAFGAELVREDPKSRVVLSRAWALKRKAWEQVVESSEKNELLQGKVVSASKKGLVVDVGVRGFVPLSHLELAAVTDVSPYVGQTLELKILEVDPRREKLVLSRRSILLKAQRKEMQELLSSLKPGEVRTGTVASLADYGAFVDLGGVSGLVHISELSWQRVSKPSVVVSVGDQVEVKILDVKPKKKRISLSMRQVTPDPLTAIEVGAVVTGPVTRLVDFGAFVAIGEFEGLVHLSELAEYRVSTPEEIVAPGDEVWVKILSVDVKRRRIELSIRRAAEYTG